MTVPNTERALVVQQFSWEDQMKALNITPGAVANLGQVLNDGEVKEAEA